MEKLHSPTVASTHATGCDLRVSFSSAILPDCVCPFSQARPADFGRFRLCGHVRVKRDRIPEDRRWMAKAAEAWSIPGIMFFSVLIGYLLGSWLDGRFGTDPWLTIIFVVAGIAGGFFEVIRIALRISK